jgi:FixJ family two-component response regulator
MMSGPIPSPQDHDQPRSNRPEGSVAPVPGIGGANCRLYLVSQDEGLEPLVRSALEGEGLRCEISAWQGDLKQIESGETRQQIVLVDDESTLHDEVMDRLAAQEGTRFGVIVLSRRGDLESAVDVMRAGAIDIVAWPCKPNELAMRIRAGAERLRQMSETERRVDRLKRICKRLNNARQEVSEQVETLCDDLASAYDDLADQMSSATLSSEFSALVQQELDVESLLRTTLEYLLSKLGPTNAAVFLPTGHDDYDLGAYVNYDVPKETADFLLDHLADVIAPRFDQERLMRRFESEADLRAVLDDDAEWLAESEVVVFACHEDDECLAIITLFRDRSSPFTPDHLAQLEVLREVFGQQLAKVVRIHHRHLPAQDNWPGFDIEGEEDYGGGMAA